MVERNFNPRSGGAFEMKAAGSQEAIEKFLELLEGQLRRVICEGGVHAVSGDGRPNLLEAARDLDLRIECYTELPEYDLPEHAVMNGGGERCMMRSCFGAWHPSRVVTA